MTPSISPFQNSLLKFCSLIVRVNNPLSPTTMFSTFRFSTAVVERVCVYRRNALILLLSASNTVFIVVARELGVTIKSNVAEWLL